MTFRIGHKVVCISEQHNSIYGDCKVPRAGNIYTVRWLGDDEILLEEIRNGVTLLQHSETQDITVGEPTFFPEDFRPLVSGTTDISALKALLLPGKQTEDA